MKINPSIDPKIAAIGSALQRMCVAASDNLGTDCFVHAVLGSALLNEYGFAATLRVGFAAWRVGEGDGDVITHRPSEGQSFAPGSIPAHAWIELAAEPDGQMTIVDFTTYQLCAKAAVLDGLDGGSTGVDWAPNLLVVASESTSSFRSVVMGKAGQYYYEHVPELSAIFQREMLDANPEDLATLRLLVENPELQAVGPNHIHALAAA